MFIREGIDQLLEREDGFPRRVRTRRTPALVGRRPAPRPLDNAGSDIAE
jgi:hypothetical protein